MTEKKQFKEELMMMKKYTGKKVQYVSEEEILRIMRQEDYDIVIDTYDAIALYVYRGEPWEKPDVVVWHE